MRANANDALASSIFAKFARFEKEVDPSGRPAHSAVAFRQPLESSVPNSDPVEDLIEFG